MDGLVQQFSSISTRMVAAQREAVTEASRLADVNRQGTETLVAENTALQGRCDAHVKTVQGVKDS